MIIKEARSSSYANWRKFDDASVKVRNEIDRLNKESQIKPDKKAENDERAGVLELSLEALNTKKEELMKYNSKVCEMEEAYANLKVSEQQGEVMKMAAEDQGKIIETARRIARGDRVPWKDEKKLMDFNKDMYMAAKQAGELAKRHEKKKTLWKEEEELELEDPMEYAGNQEMPGPAPDLSTPSDVAPDAADLFDSAETSE